METYNFHGAECYDSLEGLTPSQTKIAIDFFRAIQQVATNQVLAINKASSEKIDGITDQSVRNPHQAFMIDGERGVGKTTLLITLHKLSSRLGIGSKDKLSLQNIAWMNPEEKAEHEREFNQPVCRNLGNNIRSIYTLPVIFPDRKETEENFTMEELLALFNDELQKIINCGSQSVEFDCFTKSVEKFDLCKQTGNSKASIAIKLLDYLNRNIAGGWAFANQLGHETLSRDSIDYDDYIKRRSEQSRISRTRTRAWHNFIDCFLDLVECHLLGVFIDDSDQAPDVSIDVMRATHHYLSHPRIVTVIAVNFNTLEENIISKKLEVIEPALRAMHFFNDSEMIKNSLIPTEIDNIRRVINLRSNIFNETTEYLNKIIPRNHRRVLTVGENDVGHILRDVLDVNNITRKIDLKSLALLMLLNEYRYLAVQRITARSLVSFRNSVRDNFNNIETCITSLPFFESIKKTLELKSHAALKLDRIHVEVNSDLLVLGGSVMYDMPRIIIEDSAYTKDDDTKDGKGSSYRSATLLVDMVWTQVGLNHPFSLKSETYSSQSSMSLQLGLAGHLNHNIYGLPKNCLYYSDYYLLRGILLPKEIHLAFIHSTQWKTDFADIWNTLHAEQNEFHPPAWSIIESSFANPRWLLEPLSDSDARKVGQLREIANKRGENSGTFSETRNYFSKGLFNSVPTLVAFFFRWRLVWKNETGGFDQGCSLEEEWNQLINVERLENVNQKLLDFLGQWGSSFGSFLKNFFENNFKINNAIKIMSNDSIPKRELSTIGTWELIKKLNNDSPIDRRRFLFLWAIGSYLPLFWGGSVRIPPFQMNTMDLLYFRQLTQEQAEFSARIVSNLKAYREKPNLERELPDMSQWIKGIMDETIASWERAALTANELLAQLPLAGAVKPTNEQANLLRLSLLLQLPLGAVVELRKIVAGNNGHATSQP